MQLAPPRARNCCDLVDEILIRPVGVFTSKQTCVGRVGYRIEEALRVFSLSFRLLTLCWLEFFFSSFKRDAVLTVRATQRHPALLLLLSLITSKAKEMVHSWHVKLETSLWCSCVCVFSSYFSSWRIFFIFRVLLRGLGRERDRQRSKQPVSEHGLEYRKRFVTQQTKPKLKRKNEFQITAKCAKKISESQKRLKIRRSGRWETEQLIFCSPARLVGCFWNMWKCFLIQSFPTTNRVLIRWIRFPSIFRSFQ